MAEKLLRSLGLAELSRAVQYIAALIALIAFLVFFALAPLHALLLCGLLVILAGFVFKAEASIQKVALCAGLVLMSIGSIGIFLPSFAGNLLSVADVLKQLFILEG